MLAESQLAAKEVWPEFIDYLLPTPLESIANWDFHVQTGKLYLSPRWKQMLGFKDSEMTNDPDSWFFLVHPADMEKLKSVIYKKVLKETPHFEQEYRIRTKQGI